MEAILFLAKYLVPTVNIAENYCTVIEPNSVKIKMQLRVTSTLTSFSSYCMYSCNVVKIRSP